MESSPIQNSIDERAILEVLKYSLIAFFLARRIAFAACFLIRVAIMKLIAAMPRAIIRSFYQEVRAFEIACWSMKDVCITLSSPASTLTKAVEAI